MEHQTDLAWGIISQSSHATCHFFSRVPAFPPQLAAHLEEDLSHLTIVPSFMIEGRDSSSAQQDLFTVCGNIRNGGWYSNLSSNSGALRSDNIGILNPQFIELAVFHVIVGWYPFRVCAFRRTAAFYTSMIDCPPGLLFGEPHYSIKPAKV